MLVKQWKVDGHISVLRPSGISCGVINGNGGVVPGSAEMKGMLSMHGFLVNTLLCHPTCWEPEGKTYGSMVIGMGHEAGISDLPCQIDYRWILPLFL